MTVRRQHVWTSRLLYGPLGPYLVIGTGAAVWVVATALTYPLILVGAGAIALGVRRWQRSRMTLVDRYTLGWWEYACDQLGIANVPAIERKPNGRLMAYHSAASSTFTVSISLLRPHDDKDRRIFLRTIKDLEDQGAALKVAYGGDVTEVRIHGLPGNKARVIISRAVNGTAPRKVPIDRGDGEPVEVSVLPKAPNKAWLYNADLGGYVVAKHRHAVRWTPESGEWIPGTLAVDDDEDASVWVNDLDDTEEPPTTTDEPQSHATSNPVFRLLKRLYRYCYSLGEGSGASTPPAPQNSADWPAPNPAERLDDAA